MKRYVINSSKTTYGKIKEDKHYRNSKNEYDVVFKDELFTLNEIKKNGIPESFYDVVEIPSENTYFFLGVRKELPKENDISEATCINSDTEVGLNLNQLKSDLKSAIHEFSQENWIKMDLPEDWEKDWTRIDINESDEYIDIEIGAELSYGELDILITDNLDPAIAKYDPDAYFEQAESGIATTRIWKTYDTIEISINDGQYVYQGEDSFDGPVDWLAGIMESDEDVYYTACAIAQDYASIDLDFNEETIYYIAEAVVACMYGEYYGEDNILGKVLNYDSNRIKISDIAYDGTKFNPVHIVAKNLGTESRF